MNRFESSGGVYSFIIYSRERSLFLRAETLKNMEMWFRAIQMHADLARGGNGFTILSTQTTTTPPKNRIKKQTSYFAQLEKATQALTELERNASADTKNDCRDIGITIEPDMESSRYQQEDEVKEDPFYSNSNDFLYQPPSSVTSKITSSSSSSSKPQPQHQRPQYRHDDSLEDSTESLESIVPTVRKPASHYKSTQNANFQGVKERYDEERDISTKSGGSSSGSCRAWE